MKRNYPAIREILSAVFSVQTGLSDDAALAMYRRARESDQGLELELENVFKDGEVSWREMLFNSEYEVYETDSENEARAVAMELLLD
ncbi:MAG: hypothetical protein AAF517_09115 [Planctomycetota bacterium]